MPNPTSVEQQQQSPHEQEDGSAFIFVSRRVLQHMLGRHGVYLSSCSTAARERLRGRPLMTLLAAAATQQQRGSRSGKSKSRRVCGDVTFIWAAYEDIRKEVAANRVWPLDEETPSPPSLCAVAVAAALPPTGAVNRGVAARGKHRAIREATGVAAEAPGRSRSNDSPAAAHDDFTLDLSAELLCCHGNLIPLPLQHCKQKLSPRLLVPAAALLQYLSLDAAKRPLLIELGVQQPLAISASCLVPQSAFQCTVRLSVVAAMGGKPWCFALAFGSVLLFSEREGGKSLSTHGVACVDSKDSWSPMRSVGGSCLRPTALDVSSLICDCPVPGLKVDPTDSVFSPVFASCPPPSESAVYTVVHEAQFKLLAAHGYADFGEGSAARATVEVLFALRVWGHLGSQAGGSSSRRIR
ncbi:ubiquitin carboxyl-terminal [Cyclospora cayetanensis]|uniref:Ubiquitin carboxyl-terminal n=1 Tax=Cyclospora cayetanensis TaxID=88456 RepID=A0A1D3CRY6_9EIME|nr:ubiquitin carboxyl-terminal [Cyclospora cayetanensis]